MEHFVSRQQAADAMSVSTQTVDRLIAAGSLRSVKVGRRRVAISAESLSAYLAGITDSAALKSEDKR